MKALGSTFSGEKLPELRPKERRRYRAGLLTVVLALTLGSSAVSPEGRKGPGVFYLLLTGGELALAGRVRSPHHPQVQEEVLPWARR